MTGGTFGTPMESKMFQNPPLVVISDIPVSTLQDVTVVRTNQDIGTFFPKWSLEMLNRRFLSGSVPKRKTFITDPQTQKVQVSLVHAVDAE